MPTLASSALFSSSTTSTLLAIFLKLFNSLPCSRFVPSSFRIYSTCVDNSFLTSASVSSSPPLAFSLTASPSNPPTLSSASARLLCNLATASTLISNSLLASSAAKTALSPLALNSPTSLSASLALSSPSALASSTSTLNCLASSWKPRLFFSSAIFSFTARSRSSAASRPALSALRTATSRSRSAVCARRKSSSARACRSRNSCWDSNVVSSRSCFRLSSSYCRVRSWARRSSFPASGRAGGPIVDCLNVAVDAPRDWRCRCEVSFCCGSCCCCCWRGGRGEGSPPVIMS